MWRPGHGFYALPIDDADDALTAPEKVRRVEVVVNDVAGGRVYPRLPDRWPDLDDRVE